MHKNARSFLPDSKDSNPTIVFSGGGGVGAVANPIIGKMDLYGVDLVSGDLV